MEVFSGCNYTCQMCPQSNPEEEKISQEKCKKNSKNSDMIIPKYGTPIINLEGSGGRLWLKIYMITFML